MVAGTTVTRMPRCAMSSGVIALMPRSTATTLRVTGVPCGRLHHVLVRHRDLASEARARHGVGRAHAREQLRHRGERVAGEDPGPHDAGTAQNARELARVDAAQADDAFLGQHLVKRAL